MNIHVVYSMLLMHFFIHIHSPLCYLDRGYGDIVSVSIKRTNYKARVNFGTARMQCAS